MSCDCHAFASVHCFLMVTCWERAYVLALVCDVYCGFVTFPCGICNVAGWAKTCIKHNITVKIFNVRKTTCLLYEPRNDTGWFLPKYTRMEVGI